MTTLHICSLGHIEGHLTPEAKAEVQAYAVHLSEHREGAALNCRFCAKGRKVVTYCGSKRFRLLMQQHAMEAMAKDQNLLVLLPDWWDVKTEPGFVDMPGVAWRRKMLISERVFVFNCGGYIGDDTAADIGAARLSKKPVEYLEPSNVQQPECRPDDGRDVRQEPV